MEAILLALGLLLGLYGAAGLLSACWLHWRGLRRIDPGVEGAGIFFRLLITPGLIALWPLLLARSRGPRHGKEILGSVHWPLEAGRTRAAHAWLIWMLILLLPLAVAAAVLTRPAPSDSRVESPPGQAAPLPDSADPAARPLPAPRR